MMKQTKTLMVLMLLISLMSCIKSKPKPSANVDPNMIQSVDAPRVIRDTVIQVVILDTVDNRQPEVVRETPRAAVAPRTTTTASSTHREENDRVDRGNSGFFDSYRSGYQGDPNANLQPTVRTVIKDNSADDLTSKRESIERSLNSLEQQNNLEKEKQQRLEKERQAVNARAIEEAKAQQAQQQKQQEQQKPQGKTLNTDLLLK